MAIEVTPLGFKKPDGQEAVRGGDNVIADNAQTAQDHIASLRSRLALAEARIGTGGGDGTGTGSTLTEDPDNPGLYFIV